MQYTVAATGASGVLAFGVIAIVTGSSPLRLLATAGPPLGIFLVVLAYGVQIGGRNGPTHALKVATLGVGTTVAHVLLATWLFAVVDGAHDVLGSTEAIYLGYGIASVGLFFGVVAGHHYVRQHEQARDLQRANADLREQNDRLDEFASIVSHDLRNPLAVASGYVELADETGNLDHLDDVKTCHARIETLIDQVLALARMERDPNAITTVNVAGVATDALETVDVGDGEVLVDVDANVDVERSDLRQVFENCYRNAVEHAGPDPSIYVTGLQDGPGFAIEDDGPGIPERDRDTVFERGYTGTDGTGLGLAIVGELAATYDWDVTVRDGHDGGARFEFETTSATENEADSGGAASTTAGAADNRTEAIATAVRRRHGESRTDTSRERVSTIDEASTRNVDEASTRNVDEASARDVDEASARDIDANDDPDDVDVEVTSGTQ